MPRLRDVLEGTGLSRTWREFPLVSTVLSRREPLGRSSPRGSQSRLKAGLESLQLETANYHWKREEMDRTVFMTPEPVLWGSMGVARTSLIRQLEERLPSACPQLFGSLQGKLGLARAEPP